MSSPPDETGERIGYHQLMMSWPVFAPPLALTIIICPPLMPILVTRHDQPWWIIAIFLCGPISLAILSILIPLFKPDLLFAEKNRLEYHIITGKNLKSRPRSPTLVSKPPINGEKATSGQKASQNPNPANGTKTDAEPKQS